MNYLRIALFILLAAVSLTQSSGCRVNACYDIFGNKISGELDTDGDCIVDELDCAPDDADIPNVTPCPTDPIDADGDGISADEDCNDNDASVSPEAIELCDGYDNNCNGEIDEGVTSIVYVDADEDGFGDPNESEEVCTMPDEGSWSINGEDCNDNDASVNPGAEEVCDEIDNDCDGDILSETFYSDADGDGFGDPSSPLTVNDCGGELPEGYSRNNADCNDSYNATYPGAEERCDGEVNDCELVDLVDPDEGLPTWYSFLDADGDGMGDPSNWDNLCYKPIDNVYNPTDCDDYDPANPGLSDSTGTFADPDGDGQASCYDPSPYEFDPATSVGSWEDWLSYDSDSDDYYVISELELCGFSGGTPLGNANGPANYGVEEDGTLKEGSNDACSAMMLDVGTMESLNMLVSYELRDTTGGIWFVVPLDNGDYVVVFYAYAQSTRGAYLGIWHFDVSHNTATEMNSTRNTNLNATSGDLVVAVEHGLIEATIVGSGVTVDDSGYLANYYSSDRVGLDIHEIGVGSMDNDTRVTFQTFTVTNPGGWEEFGDGVTWVPSGS